MDKWIWLDESLYPQNQITRYSLFHENGPENYTVAEFRKTYEYQKQIKSVDMYFSADTRFQLYLNNEILTTGPVMVGGDWLGNDKKRSYFYATHTVIFPNSKKLDFVAKVLMMPIQMCDYSMGHGGFMLRGEITFSDGTKEKITTDKTWIVRKLESYKEPYVYDERIMSGEFHNAQEIADIWNCKAAPIPPMTEEVLKPSDGGLIYVDAKEKCRKVLEFDRVYAGYVDIHVKTKGEIKIYVKCKETTGDPSFEEKDFSFEKTVFIKDSVYRSFRLHSAAYYDVEIENNSDGPSEVQFNLISRYYPINQSGKIVTSDKDLNKVTELCSHNLKICRQSLHLDSPRHCEPLACTGDYYIETLMTLFSYGDMNLAKFDIRRQARMMQENNGRIFHTTYSLIWIYWLFDVYMFTGDKELLSDCQEALDMLLSLFETYMGENGLVETPPDYMFVDWIYVDGFSLHHPPKALGQSCLNMFLYKGIKTAEKIYDILGEHAKAAICNKKAINLQNAVNTYLYDNEKEMYFEGLNTPTDESLLNIFMPQNTDKRYYLKHSNILAAYSGICDKKTACNLIDRIMKDEIPGDVQPYFLHFLLEAVYENGLRQKYTLEILEKWKDAIKNCDKGLPEGFIPPDSSYHFDYSHGWGGSPLYSLPKALLGFEIIQPGMKEIQISPNLFGLEFANIKMPTAYGYIDFKLANDNKPYVDAPNQICVKLKTMACLIK
ncbi:MAG: hypothetical protein IKV88_07155 [Clostridia bacterium]|nr:hypothetical protein [Clostridia bacterium]